MVYCSESINAFPIIRIFSIPPNRLEYLHSVIEYVEARLFEIKENRSQLSTHDLLWSTHDLIELLRSALDPVIKIWEHTFDVSELELPTLPCANNTLRVLYWPDDWAIISRSIQLQSELINIVFEPKN